VRVALIEKQLEHELVEVNLAAGEHRGDSFRRLNALGKVPVLEDGDFVLPESAAILWYVESKHPTPPLVPALSQSRAQVDLWVRLCDANMGRHAGTVIFPKRFLPPAKWDQAAMAAASAELQKHLELVETQLADREFLVGDTFTLADIVYLPMLHFLGLMDVEAGPRVQAWSARLAARPSAQATVPAA
jgi:glutathione S-transferase